MRITHLGHSCLLVEAGGQRILVDPGVFSSGIADLTGLDAIMVTHQHPDHMDLVRLPVLTEINPQARLYAEPQAAAAMEQSGIGAERTTSGKTLTLGSLEVTPVGERHALINDALPRVGNMGFVMRARGEPSLFHPGDAYDGEPGQVDILALPLNAPWAASRDSVAFAQRISPRVCIPIHDGLLNAVGRQLYLSHVEAFGPEGMEVRDLADGKPSDFT
ncbi:MAG: MBL fold metallo-hydrolase [Actinomycetota bacterium]